ncbi:hypothetical protein DFH28DRAFT_962877 [Melampsora americana]|nr:hypothetical protein DFH28DRAFT_962877 [Melampsora americana]
MMPLVVVLKTGYSYTYYFSFLLLVSPSYSDSSFLILRLSYYHPFSSRPLVLAIVLVPLLKGNLTLWLLLLFETL